MKIFKKLTCLTLAMLMVLLLATACTPSGGVGEDIVGRYVEHEVTPETDATICIMKKLADGSIVVYTEGFTEKFVSKDSGRTWEKSAGPGANSTRFANSYHYSIAPDGTIFIIEVEIPEGSEGPLSESEGASSGSDGSGVGMPEDEYVYQKETLFKITPDGTIEEVIIKDIAAYAEQGKAFSFNSLFALTNEIAFLTIYEQFDYSKFGNDEEYIAEPIQRNLMVNLTTGEIMFEKEDDIFRHPAFMRCVGKNFYMTDYDGNIYAFNLQTGKKVDLTNKSFKGEANSEGSYSYNFIQNMLVDENGDIYVIDNEGLRVSRKDGSDVENIMKSSSYKFGASGGGAYGFEMLDKAFLMLLGGKGEGKVFLFEWDKDAVWSAAESITVWSLYNISSLRTAIGVYRSKFPNGLVEYEIGLTVEYNATRQDIDAALQSLNTRMLAGEGPDVLILDGTNIKNYVNNGMLHNLAGVVDTSEMYDKIVSSFKTDNEMYYIPTRFELPVLMGKKEEVDDIDSFDKFIKKVVAGPDIPVLKDDDYDTFYRPLKEEERPNYFFESVYDIFEILWMSSGDKVIKDGKIDKEQLKILLEKTKQIAEKYNLTDRNTSGGWYETWQASEAYRFPSSMYNYTQHRANGAAFVLDRITMLAEGNRSSEKIETYIATFPGILDATWSPKANVAISASSAHKESAADLIQALLSKEAQGELYSAGMPVTKAGAEAQKAAINKQLQEDASWLGNETEYAPFELDYDTFVNSIGAPMINDVFLHSTLFETADKYCYGEIDLEGAVKEIDQKLKIYLGEQQ